MAELRIFQAQAEEQIKAARELFLEYAEGLGIDLCFQDFDREVAELPGDYAPPGGRILLGLVGEEVAGCVAVRGLNDGACEMKRLYVRPSQRGSGIGRRLVREVIAAARGLCYKRLLLDTLPVMAEAQRLYEYLGFREIEPYYENPVPGARFLELDL